MSPRGSSAWALGLLGFGALWAVGCHKEALPAACSLHARPLAAAIGFDANSDGAMDVADGTWLLARNLRGGADPPCLDAVEAFGDRVSDSGTAYALWYALIAGTAVPSLAAGTCGVPEDVEAACGDGLALAISAPESATGSGGDTASFAATVTLRSPDLPVEAWSVSVEASGCTVTAVGLDGTSGADIRDDPPGARDGGLGMAQPSSAGGAVSMVVLDPIGGATVQPAEATAILALTVEAPVGDACAPCTLSLVDGQAGKGRALTNTASSSGRSYAPETSGASIQVCPSGG